MPSLFIKDGDKTGERKRAGIRENEIAVAQEVTDISFPYQYNGERVLGELNDYIKCTTSHNYRKNLYYGIEANRKLRDYLIYCITNYDTPVVDLRYSRAYMEHKSILYMCFKYLV